MSTYACPTCGNLNRFGAKFCGRCGAALTAPPQSGGYETGRLGANSLINDRYVVVRVIGRGGMGAVYLVTDTLDQNRVMALKEMSNAAIVDPRDRAMAVDQFRREAQLLRRLRHPNLPVVTDEFAIGDRNYLVMEYVPGSTLQQMIDRGEGPFPESRVVAWANQLCDVLDYLHRQQPAIIFRDLKPANIMIMADDRLKLIDFGIARIFKPGQHQDTMLLGTQGYAAPEQYGGGQSDARSDIYALGATLFLLLTGQDPGQMAPMKPLPSVHQYRPEVSPYLESIILRATRINVGERWQSTQELRQAIATVTLRVDDTPVKDFYTQLSALQRAMASAFSQSELKDIAFALGVFDFASLPGETKEDKARELIGRMVREDRLPQLLALCRRERPTVAWPFVGRDGPAPPSNPLGALFQEGIHHQVRGYLADALQVFEGIYRIDPNFPGLQSKLGEIRYEMRRDYVDPSGRVNPYKIFPHAAPSAPPPASHRPTTRLLMRAAGLSNRQLALAGVGLLLAVVLAIVTLTQTLFRIPVIWNNVRFEAAVGPFAYAATRRRFVAGLAHLVVVVPGQWLVLAMIDRVIASASRLLVGAALSAVVIEAMIWLLPRVLGKRQRDDAGAWQREAGWLGLTAVLAYIALQWPVNGMVTALNVVAWIIAFLLGVGGWFLGDLAQGYVYLRQTGTHWR